MLLQLETQEEFVQVILVVALLPEVDQVTAISPEETKELV
jgi:hypothetical protein